VAVRVLIVPLFRIGCTKVVKSFICNVLLQKIVCISCELIFNLKFIQAREEGEGGEHQTNNRKIQDEGFVVWEEQVRITQRKL
jgi:hypothetical protein